MIIYGKNTVKEAIYAKRKIFDLFIENDNKVFRFWDFEDIKLRKINLHQVNKQFLNNLTGVTKHQGVAAKVANYKYYNLDIYLDLDYKDKIQRFLILDQVQDPHNFGAIIRTIEAFAFDGIIISDKHQVPLNATVAKIASGALEYVKIFLVKNIYQTILKLKKYNIFVIVTDDKASHEISQIPLNRSLAIIVGNEGQGTRFLLKKHANLSVQIHMRGKINSLNVSVAAALFVYYSCLK